MSRSNSGDAWFEMKHIIEVLEAKKKGIFTSENLLKKKLKDNTNRISDLICTWTEISSMLSSVEDELRRSKALLVDKTWEAADVGEKSATAQYSPVLTSAYAHIDGNKSWLASFLLFSQTKANQQILEEILKGTLTDLESEDNSLRTNVAESQFDIEPVSVPPLNLEEFGLKCLPDGNVVELDSTRASPLGTMARV